MDQAQLSLIETGRWLQSQSYAYTTPTPSTIDRVNARPENREAVSLRDIFGWNRPFTRDRLPAALLERLVRAGCVERRGPMFGSRIRFSTLGGRLFAHSGVPTIEQDAVFFGPDTYRFIRFVRQTAMAAHAPRSVLDICCGSGAGGLSLLDLWARPPALVLADISPRALRFAAVNAALSDADDASVTQADLCSGLPRADLIIANPPYLLDSRARTYRHGGDHYGTDLSLRIARECIHHLQPGGALILYTGAPIIQGNDVFRHELELWGRAESVSFSYEELDPDVFGEELERPQYQKAERIAVVGVVITHR